MRINNADLSWADVYDAEDYLLACHERNNYTYDNLLHKFWDFVEKIVLRNLSFAGCSKFYYSSGRCQVWNDARVHQTVSQSERIQILTPYFRGTTLRNFRHHGVSGRCIENLSSFCRFGFGRS